MKRMALVLAAYLLIGSTAQAWTWLWLTPVDTPAVTIEAVGTRPVIEEFTVQQTPDVGQADPSMTFTIPSAKFADFKAAWLKVYPNNETEDADADPDTPETPKYTDNQWLKVSARRHLMSVYRQGKHMIAEESTPDPGIDEGVIVDD